jgi:hypothetical protein
MLYIMLSAIGFFVVLTAAIFAYRSLVPRSVHEAGLGRMSTQWINEHRSSKNS